MSRHCTPRWISPGWSSTSIVGIIGIIDGLIGIITGILIADIDGIIGIFRVSTSVPSGLESTSGLVLS